MHSASFDYLQNCQSRKKRFLTHFMGSNRWSSSSSTIRFSASWTKSTFASFFSIRDHSTLCCSAASDSTIAAAGGNLSALSRDNACDSTRTTSTTFHPKIIWFFPSNFLLTISRLDGKRSQSKRFCNILETEFRVKG